MRMLFKKYMFTPLNYSQRFIKTYKDAYKLSITNSEEFWANIAEKIVWFKKWNRVIANPNSTVPKWFEGGLTNACYNCVDRHVEEGYKHQIAIIQESPVTSTHTQYTYNELLEKISQLAGFMAHNCQINKGDRVLIYMPMIPEAMISMLASARLGAIHVVVFGGFSAKQLSNRIQKSKPKIIVTASYGVEKSRLIDYKSIVEKAIDLSGCRNNIEKCLFLNRKEFEKMPLGSGTFYVEWNEAVQAGKRHDAVPLESGEPLYLLHTSGTTGNPKGIVRDNGGYLVGLKYTADMVFNMEPDEAWWACSEFGWVVGHSFCCYAPLIQRAKTIIYEGKPIGTPDAAQYFRVLKKHAVSGWLLSPSAARAIRSEDPNLEQSQHLRSSLNNLKNVFLVGEHCDVSTITWLYQGLPSHVRMVDNWWQTETGWPITSCCLGYPDGAYTSQGVAAPLGSAGLPLPGYDIHFASVKTDFADKQHNSNSEHELKQILVKLPLPPGAMINLWDDEERFNKEYFEEYPGYYDTKDMGYKDENGFCYIMARSDDVINVAGHRLSTSELEEVCLTVSDIVDCAVIPIQHPLKGEVPFGVFVIAKNAKQSGKQILETAFQAVRKSVGPVASFQKGCIVDKLPKTRSGKISRGSMAKMAAGEDLMIPVTIEDPTVYEGLHQAFKEAGLNPSLPKPV